MRLFVAFVFVTFLSVSTCGPEESEGVKYASKCEVCKILSIELQDRLEESSKTSEVIETGYSIEKSKKKTEYTKSELRLLESLEGLCERVLNYNLHKEREDSTRFQKGMSQTFKTLHGLVDKGVKVELGIPYELWDKPPAEVTDMKTKCETLLEENEEAIEDWYFNHQEAISLEKFLCTQRALKGDDDSCLMEKLSAEAIKEKSKPSEKSEL